MQFISITTKGQVTIPKDIRDRLGFAIGEKVLFEENEGLVKIRLVPDFFSYRGALRGKKVHNRKAIYKNVGIQLSQRYTKNLSNGQQNV